MMSRQRFGCCPATWAPFAPGGERNAMAGEVRCPGAELENDRVFDDPSARESSTETVPGVIHEPVGGLPALDADEVGGGRSSAARHGPGHLCTDVLRLENARFGAWGEFLPEAGPLSHRE